MPDKRETAKEEALPFLFVVVAAALELELLVSEDNKEEEKEELDEVVAAVVDLGTLSILLVLVPKSKELPSLASVTFVPSLSIITPPGVMVVPDPRSYMVLPLETVAGYVWPSIVRAGASVMGPDCPMVEDCPLTMMTPYPVVGSEKVVPDTTSDPPAVRVSPEPRMKDVAPSEILAVMAWPLTVSTGAGVGIEEPNMDVCPLMTIAEPVAGQEKVVPDTASEPPGVRVDPGAKTKAVEEPETLAVIVWAPKLKTGTVVWPDPSTEDFPLTKTAEPPPEGRLNVVPEIVRAPPGVRVWSGARTKAVDDPDMLAVTAWPPMVSTGAAVGLAARLCV